MSGCTVELGEGEHGAGIGRQSSSVMKFDRLPSTPPALLSDQRDLGAEKAYCRCCASAGDGQHHAPILTVSPLHERCALEHEGATNPRAAPRSPTAWSADHRYLPPIFLFPIGPWRTYRQDWCASMAGSIRSLRKPLRRRRQVIFVRSREPAVANVRCTRIAATSGFHHTGPSGVKG